MRKKSWEIQSFKLASGYMLLCSTDLMVFWNWNCIVLTMVLATCSYSGTTLKSVIHENVNVNPGLSFSVQCSLACASIFTFQSVKMHVQAKSRIYIYTLH